MTIFKIIQILAGLFKILSEGDHWFTTTPSRSAAYRITLAIINACDQIEHLIGKKSDIFFDNGSNLTVFQIIENLYNVIIMSDDMTSKSEAYMIAQEIINAGNQLKLIIKKQNEELVDGDAYFERNELTIVLLRDGEHVYHNFSEQQVKVEKTNKPKDISDLKLESPPDEDGFIYYLYSRYVHIGCVEERGFYLTKKEAEHLGPLIKKLKNEEYGLDQME